MTLSQNIRHRRAAIHRRDPQLGFSPTAVFNRPTPPFSFPTFGPGLPGDNGDNGDDGNDGDNSGDDDTVTVTFTVPPTTSAHPTLNLPPTSSPTSSSAPTSSTTPTTSSTPTTSATPTSVTPSTTPTPTTTTLPTTTPTLTPSKTLSPLSLSSTPAKSSATAADSNANNNDSSSSISTGAIVGGIAAGIVAIAAIGFAIIFFIRRAKRRNSNDFDDNNFRRSAMVLDDDPPTTEDAYGSPRPPSMIQRHMASPAPTFGTMYGRPGPAPDHTQTQNGAYGYGGEYGQQNQNYAGYGSNYQSYGPGQVMNAYGHGPSAYPASSMTPQTTLPMYPASPYAQSPFSPVSPTEQYGFHNNALAAGAATAGGAVNGAGYPVLTRKTSTQSNESVHGQQSAPANANQRRSSVPANDYVDLNRSSVSPYQAAQYVEISRRLNTEPPAGLRTADLERELPPPPRAGQDAPSSSSPFADPSSAPPSPSGAQYAIDRRHLNAPSVHHERTFSGDSEMPDDAQTLEFPAPPAPAHAAPQTASRYRIDSMPPSLPEINIEASRVSVGSYAIMRDSRAPSMSMLPVGLTPGGLSATASRFPTTPSPLASSFGMPSPPATAATGHGAAFDASVPPSPLPPVFTPGAASTASAPAAPVAREPSEHALDKKKRNTNYSMYDAEDAYGGI